MCNASPVLLPEPMYMNLDEAIQLFPLEMSQIEVSQTVLHPNPPPFFPSMKWPLTYLASQAPNPKAFLDFSLSFILHIQPVSNPCHFIFQGYFELASLSPFLLLSLQAKPPSSIWTTVTPLCSVCFILDSSNTLSTWQQSDHLKTEMRSCYSPARTL